MRFRRALLACSVLFVALGCGRRRAAEAGSNATDISAETWRSQPRIGIDVVPNDRDITLGFRICGSATGRAFVDRLIVRKLRPEDEAGTVCEFESEGEAVLSGAWPYGESRQGLERCWPLTEGEYVAVAIGSGGGQTRFSLTKRWLGSGYAVHILEPSCL